MKVLRASSLLPLRTSGVFSSSSLGSRCLATSTKGDTSVPILDTSVGDLLTEQVQKHEHKDVLISSYQNVRWTFKELNKHSRAMGAGVSTTFPSKTGDLTMGAIFDYDVELVLTFLGAGLSGNRFSPSSPFIGKEAISDFLKGSAAKTMMFRKQFKGVDMIPLWYDLINELTMIQDGGPPVSRTFPHLEAILQTQGYGEHGIHHVRDILYYDPTPDPLPKHGEVSPSSVFAIIPTNTDSQSDWVAFDHRSVVNGAAFYGQQVGVTSSDRICYDVPNWQIYSQVTGPLTAISHAAVAVTSAKSFNAENASRCITRDSISIWQCTPEQLNTFLEEAKPKNLSTLKKIVVVTQGDEEYEAGKAVGSKALERFDLEDVFVAPCSRSCVSPFVVHSLKNKTSNLAPHLETKLDNDQVWLRGVTGPCGKWNTEKHLVETIPDGWFPSQTSKQVLSL
eukprot:CAMPEP_0174261140 /NCGR_PEP_ID=MMETSP0439-20130205/11257_1 /TAXON_ID=0 /ORGANISM="Stereomyxa ramosa, Strain Chinc5" /LENGTH=449 /DNA_ID=CAMNT_0015345569 /DNA_START=13 /DNA_END=1362 /DNA_ORIENTATION=-